MLSCAIIGQQWLLNYDVLMAIEGYLCKNSDMESDVLFVVYAWNVRTVWHLLGLTSANNTCLLLKVRLLEKVQKNKTHR